MDRRTLLAITLSVTVYVVWFALFPPVPPPVPSEPGEAPVASASATASPTSAPPAPAAASVPDRVEGVRLCAAQGELHTSDGSLRSLVLVGSEARYRVQPLYAWALSGFSGPWQPYGPEPGPAPLLGADAAGFVAGAGTSGVPVGVEVVENTPGRLVTRGRTAEGVLVERTFRAEGEGVECVVKLDVTWRNEGSAPVVGGTWLGVHDAFRASEGGYDLPMRPRAGVEGEVWGLDAADDFEGTEVVEGGVDWFGLTDTYFALLALPTSSEGRVVLTSSPGQAAPRFGYQHVVADTLAPGQVRTASYTLYAGPKLTERLAAVDARAVEAVELGFFAAFGKPLLWLLQQLHGLGLGWGLSIIALTFLVKAVFFPLTQAGFKSGAAMSALQPELAKLRELHANNPEELNRRTIELFQKNGVNPLGGCLPMLLQMPVWFALFTVLQNAAEIYHAEFLYLKDLSAPDPYLVSPVVVSALMIVQQRMTPMGNLDPAQQQMMKIMPVIFSIFFFLLPSGLNVYTFVNMLLSIAQQAYIRRSTPIPAKAASPS
jgi:YidC/Oxa1 family membrane protein insertase